MTQQAAAVLEKLYERFTCGDTSRVRKRTCSFLVFGVSSIKTTDLRGRKTWVRPDVR